MAIYVNNNLTRMAVNAPRMAVNNIHVTQVQKAFMIIYGAIRDNSCQ